VVVSALHSIADARCLNAVLVDFLLEFANEGGTHHLINLLESSNLDVVEAALCVVRCIHCICCDDCPLIRPVLRHFLKHGIIQALLGNLACDSSRLFQQTAQSIALCWMEMESPLVTPTVLHLIRLLPSLEDPAKLAIISTMDDLIEFHGDYTQLDPSIPRLFLQLAQDEANSLELLNRIVRLICRAVFHCIELRGAFQTAGAESFLTDPQLLSRLTEQDDGCGDIRDNIQDALDLLRSSYSDSSD
jgi:hypothetical protein